jgi:WD40 repeat protein
MNLLYKHRDKLITTGLDQKKRGLRTMNTRSNRFIKLVMSVLLAGSLSPVATAAMPANYVGIQQLAFSQDGSQILYFSNRVNSESERSNAPVIHFINANNGSALNSTTLAINPQRQLPMGFTPDGFKQAVLEARGLSILHNKTGATLRTLAVPGLPNPVTRYRPTQAITNASGTQQLFLSANKQQLYVIHTGNGKNLGTIRLPASPLLSFGTSSNGRTVAYLVRGTAGKNQLQLYDIYQKKVTQTLDIAAQSFTPLALPITLSGDGKFAYTPRQLVELSTGKTTALPLNQTDVPALFTADNRYLLLPQKNNQLVRLDLKTQQKQFINLNLPAHCQTASAYDFSPNGAWLALGSSCRKGAEKADFISLLNARTGQLIRHLRPVPTVSR